MMNEDLKNKQKVKAFLTKLKVKKVTVLTYYLQANDMIECEHTLIMQALLKFCKNQLY